MKSNLYCVGLVLQYPVCSTSPKDCLKNFFFLSIADFFVFSVAKYNQLDCMRQAVFKKDIKIK